MQVNPTDEALVHSMADGQREALGQLYDRYAGLLFTAGQRILKNPKEAEDLLHDVFLEAWKTAQSYNPDRGSVRAWLLIRLRSRALDRCRAAHLLRHRTGDLAGEQSPSADEDHEDPALGPDRTLVRQALLALPTEQRQVLELGYFEGLTSSEIAARIQVPIGTVKSRVATALMKLRIRFDCEGRSAAVIDPRQETHHE